MAVSTCARRLSNSVARLGTGLFAALLAAPTLAATLEVSKVEFWSLEGSTRVSIEISGEFRYKSDRLSKPDRLFFDIANSHPTMVGKGEYKVGVGDTLLKQVRLAETKPGVTRVVLDLEDGVEFTASQLSNPARLMVELRAKGAKVSKISAPAKPVETARVVVETPKPVESPKSLELARPIEAGKNGESAASPKFPPLEPTRSSLPPAPASLPPAPAVTATKSEPAPPKPIAVKPPPVSAAPLTVASTTPVVPEPQTAARNSNGDRSLTRVLGLKAGRIVIDPGHGGHDPGTHGKSGMVEKDLVLDISKRLAKLLEERTDFEVVLTRSDDTFVALEDRTAIANNAKADLFLSIHANSNPLRTIAGIETYYLNFSASREDLDLATRENATARTTIADLREVVSKIALRAKLDESREFAVQLHTTLNAAATVENKEAKSRPVKKAPFVVLIGSEMPAVLAEIGYLSNAREEELFQGEAHRDRVAQALLDGIAAYMKTLGQGARAALE